MDPRILLRNLKIKESQCPERQPEGQGRHRGHQGPQDDRPDVRRLPDPGRQVEETSAGRLAGHLRQRSRADPRAGRRREGRTVEADRPAQSGVGLSQKRTGLIA